MAKLNPHKNRTTFKDKTFYMVESHTGCVFYFSYSPTIGDLSKLDPDYDPSGDDDLFSISELIFER